MISETPSPSSKLPAIDTLAELAAAVADRAPVYLRYSEGPEADAEETSRDSESGLDLPGLSVNPLTPEAWWTRPVEDWLARQICQYKHLADEDESGSRFAWVLAGESVGAGPDCEPLIAEARPIARLSDRLLDEAERRYTERFAAGKGPTD